MTHIPASNRDVTPVDNRPPLITTEELLVDHSAYVQKAAEFKAMLDGLPANIDEATYGPWLDVVGDIDRELKSVERTRVDVKAPFLRGERTVDGCFNIIATSLTDTRSPIAAALKAHLQRKAAAERARQEEIARKAREEEDAKRAEAAEAARRAQALENQRRSAAASEKRVEASIATQDAINANVAAAAASKAASAKPADLARTRSETGSLGTLAEHWVFGITDPMALPAADLWPYISADAKEKAVRAYVRAGGRTLAGARIFNDTDLQVRR